MRRFAIAGALAAIALVAPLAARADDANRACTDGQGVTMVVDFQSLGGGVNVRCAAQPINNGYDVFHHANVSYETVSGKDFVCKIATQPTDANCSTYPPQNYYWSYWWAQPGEDWHYATKGAGAHKPAPGAYEGWSFVSSDTASPPRYPVPPAPTTTTTTTMTAAIEVAPTTTALGRSSAGSARATPPTVVTTTTAPTTTTVVEAETSTSLALGHVNLSQHGDGGSSRGFILSAVAVVGLGAFAIAVARSRGR